jgi:hypothetical protein
MGPLGYFLISKSMKPLSSVQQLVCAHTQTVSLHTLIADGGVGSEGSLLIIGALVLCEKSTGNVKARNLVRFGELEAQALSVMVDELDVRELEGDPTLITTSESLLGLNANSLLHVLGSGRNGSSALAEIPVTSTANSSSSSSVEEGVGAASASSLGGISTNRL